MTRFAVAARGQPTTEIDAPNWLVALGLGLEQLGHLPRLERLACEVLANGTIIARDAATGAGYVVQPAEDTAGCEVDDEEPLAVDAGEELEDDLAERIDAEDDHTACSLVLDHACELVGAESGSIILVVGDILRFVAILGPNADALQDLEIPQGSGIAGHAIRTGRVVVVGQAPSDPRHFADVDAMIGNPTRDLICVPIVAGKRVLGVLEALNLAPGSRFSRHDIHGLQALGRLLGERLDRGVTEPLPESG